MILSWRWMTLVREQYLLTQAKTNRIRQQQIPPHSTDNSTYLGFVGGTIYFLSKDLRRRRKPIAVKGDRFGAEDRWPWTTTRRASGENHHFGQRPSPSSAGQRSCQEGRVTGKTETANSRIKSKAFSSFKTGSLNRKEIPHSSERRNSLRISKKYGISVEELRKRNNLSADQPIRTGKSCWFRLDVSVIQRLQEKVSTNSGHNFSFLLFHLSNAKKSSVPSFPQFVALNKNSFNGGEVWVPFLPFLQNSFNEKDILILGIHTKIFSSQLIMDSSVILFGFFLLSGNTPRSMSPLSHHVNKFINNHIPNIPLKYYLSVNGGCDCNLFPLIRTFFCSFLNASSSDRLISSLVRPHALLIPPKSMGSWSNSSSFLSQAPCPLSGFFLCEF